MKRLLVIAAHPDDEALGCAGTIARHVAQGGTAKCIFMTNGVDARGADGEESARRADSARRAARILGCEQPELLDFPDNAMDSVPLISVVRAIERTIADFAPEDVLTHHGCDLNVDHRITNQAVATACRPIVGRTVRQIRCFETLSSTEWSPAPTGPAFRPSVFVDISDYLETKITAIDAYRQEMRQFPHPRSPEVIRAQATLRGSSAGLCAAEAFELLRRIER
jgi:LmbE family N-acetylglucosaminyl deacetylase